MNDFLSLQEKIKSLASATGAKAVYLVGINDGLILSDYDLIVVMENVNPQIRKQWLNLGPTIDLRRLVRVADFKSQNIYWPHANYELIFGEDLRGEITAERKKKLDLIKLAELFFTSFLRNYYRLLDSQDQAEILRNLNDWCYVKLFLPEVMPEFQDLISNIKKARLNYPNNSDSELKNLLEKTISGSWHLVDILNNKLKIEFESIYPAYFSTYREVTIFTPANNASCRKLTEKYLIAAKKFKIIFLPTGFQFINSQDLIIKQFIKTNSITKGHDLLFYLKRLGKIIFGFCLFIFSRK